MNQPHLRVALLGPLRLWRDGTEVAAGPRQQRVLLTLLLARAGRLVEIGEITDLIWSDEQQPPTAVNMVHRYVGALRRVLEPGLRDRSAGSWIVRDEGGYRFEVDGADVDLVTFREHLGQAGEQVTASDDERALELLVSALKLWRGRCGAGLGDAVESHPDIAAIDREYVMAAREAAQVARRCGRSALILPAIREAAARHPLDEALQAELLLLLAADGNQAAALALFGEISTRLDEELGISPGPELSTAYETVLRPPATPEQSPGGSGAALPPPAQLPSDLPFFTGRDEVVRTTVDLLTQDHSAVPIVAFTGMPGVGKTTLAVHVAHQVAASFPDGQLYADLHGFDARAGAADPADVLQSFLGALGVEQGAIPASVEARASLFRSAVAGRRLLVLLDNARDTDQIRPLLPGTAGNALC